MIFSLRK